MIRRMDKNQLSQGERPIFTVVHPLDDAPEAKIDLRRLGPMRITRTVRFCLLALRAYLLLMLGLLAIRVWQLASVIRG